jgi:uncharacterized protein
MALNYRVFRAIRHRAASTAAERAATNGQLAELAGVRQAVLCTVTADGRWIPTPVNIAVDGERVLFRAEPHSLKIRRLTRQPNVKLFASTFRGKPRGPVLAGTATVLDGAAAERAAALVAEAWRWDMRVIERGFDRIGVPEAYVEIVARGTKPST